MLALAIFMGVILLCTSSENKKPKKKSQPRTLHGSSSGYDPDRQVHWTREDTMEFREL